MMKIICPQCNELILIINRRLDRGFSLNVFCSYCDSHSTHTTVGYTSKCDISKIGKMVK